MQKRVGQVGQRVQHRPGEGHVIDMTILSTDAESTTVELASNTLPVPDRRFTCDAIQVVCTAVGARLLLAQRQPVGEGLLAMLVLSMAPDPTVQFLRTVDAQFLELARQCVDSQGGQLAASVFTENAQQSVVLTCSYVLAGFTGLSGCMDFYNASPFSIQHMAALKKLALEPVVRVNLSTGLMLQLLDALKLGAQEWNWESLGKRNARI